MSDNCLQSDRHLGKIMVLFWRLSNQHIVYVLTADKALVNSTISVVVLSSKASIGIRGSASIVKNDVTLWMYLSLDYWGQFETLWNQGKVSTSTGIDADASKGETSPGYFNSKLVYSYRCGTIFPWEFPEISLAYSHIFMKGPSRSIIYGQIFWHPHPHPHIASPACI